MGRPSKKAERTEEILQAFYRCVARYGIEGSTLERIAEESGLKRSLVRHFVGNRDELVSLLVDRVLEQSDAQWSAFIDYLPANNVVTPLLDGLFCESYSDAEYILVIESLIFAAGRDDALRQRMQQWLQRFTDDMVMLLQRDHPEASPAQLETVSFGVISIYFNLDSLAPLGMNQQYRQPAYQAAQCLIGSLAKPAGEVLSKNKLH
ncbi:MAG: TetR/AcrR family transcriptional regulator [Marinobacterium sp.]|nr:TetR/AcrR family transcriptional regulator [Marinobacterium sp.]